MAFARFVEQLRAGQVSALVHMADAQQALGRYADSLTTLSEAKTLAGEGAGPAELAAIHGAIGNAYVALGPPGEAREHLEKALGLARTAEAGRSRRRSTNLGNLPGRRIRTQRAAAPGRGARDEAGDPALAARAHANQAQAAERAGAPAGEVRAALARATELADGLPDSHAKATVLINAGRTYARLGDLELAHGCFGRAQAVAEATRDARAQSYALGYLARSTKGGGGSTGARLPAALFQAQQANAPESLYRWHWQVGRILAAKGSPAEAIPSYQQAVLVLSGIRFDMAHGYATGGGSFRDAVGRSSSSWWISCSPRRPILRMPPPIRRGCARRAKCSRSSRRRSSATTSATSAWTRSRPRWRVSTRSRARRS
jgi:tetratricopeptide (TPR) repeat protein